MIPEKWVPGLVIGVLLLAAAVMWAAAQSLVIEAERADEATELARAAAWQVSQLLQEAREITRQAAERPQLP